MNTLIILDWDDTLFPTTWTMSNSVDLEKINMDSLDTILSKILKLCLSFGKVIIVTNAMLKWIKISMKPLPNTQKIVENRINVLSARELFQKKFPNDRFIWKKLIFKELMNNNFEKNIVPNIVSIGDAEYEFNALVNLDNYKKRKYLKAIRFMAAPSYEILLDQLDVLHKSIPKIVKDRKHYDLTFDLK